MGTTSQCGRMFFSLFRNIERLAERMFKKPHTYRANCSWKISLEVKVNYDALLDKDATMVKIVVVCRDSNGSIIDGSNAIVSTGSPSSP